MEDTQLSLFGKTSPERSAHTKARISEKPSKRLPRSQTPPPMFLDLRKGNGGLLEPSWEMDGLWLGEPTMRNFGESPSVAVESRLSWILEPIVHPKYCLTDTACRGILRRSNTRDNELPSELKAALEYQAEHYPEIIRELEAVWEAYKANSCEISPTITGGQETHCICIQGNCVDRSDTAGCNGKGWTYDKAYTLNTVDRHCVFENHSQDSRVTGPYSVSSTVSAKWGTGGNNTPLVMATGQAGAEILQNQSHTLNCNHEQPIVCGIDCRNATENGDLIGTLQAHESGGFSLNCISPVRIGSFVRRMTPLECERLQGYQDGWTDIGEWADSKGKRHKESSDSARYKACGNSIALPFWFWLTQRIAEYLPNGATLGSLFDGIGGFPLCWETVHGKGSAVWASEIEEFPMAVTRRRFGKEDEE